MKNQLPDHSPLFIFPFSIDPEEGKKEKILSACREFLSGWKAHSQPVSAIAWTEENRFLLITADPSVNLPGGCSKDKLFHFVSNLMKETRLGEVPLHLFWVKSGEQIKSMTKNELQEQVSSGLLLEDSPLFPTWISELGQFKNLWGKPISFFPALMGLKKAETKI